jgi:hypothetical protein
MIKIGKTSASENAMLQRAPDPRKESFGALQVTYTITERYSCH